MYSRNLAIVAVAIVLLMASRAVSADPTFQTLTFLSVPGYSNPTGSATFSGTTVYIATAKGVLAFNTATNSVSAIPVANPTFLTANAVGNVYGVAGDFSIFQIAADTHSLSTVRAFSSTTIPGYLVADAVGNVYGQTGVSSANATLFSLTTSGTFTTYPAAGVYAHPGFIDGQGNVVGVNPAGGSAGVGATFTLNPSTGSVTTVAQFNDTGVGGYYPTTVVADSSGNQYGFANINITNSGNTMVYKLPVGTTVPITQASAVGNFNTIPTGLISDAVGDLFGVTRGGGTSGAGTIFEIPAGSSTVTTLLSFSVAFQNPLYGVQPIGLFSDGSGNLYGVTEGQGQSILGSVFELSGTGFVVSAGTSAPEPASLGLLALGAAVLALGIRRRRQA